MNTIKKAMIPAMLSLVASCLTASLAHADTYSDVRYQCLLCHDVTVSPSSWVLSLGAVGTPSGRISGERTLAGWQNLISSMAYVAGFTTLGPGGTSQAAAAQLLYDMQYVATPTSTPTFTPTVTVTSTFTPTVTAAPPSPSVICTPPPTPQCPNEWVSGAPWGTCFHYNGCPTYTPTSTGPHAWYDYDYLGGRCFSKDHSIMERKWCEQHGMKGGGNHPSLTGYDRHAHLDYPGQKP